MKSSNAFHDSFNHAAGLHNNIHPLAWGWKYSISLKRDSDLSENLDIPASKKENTCSARLQAGTFVPGKRPPEGGRYTGQIRDFVYGSSEAM